MSVKEPPCARTLTGWHVTEFGSSPLRCGACRIRFTPVAALGIKREINRAEQERREQEARRIRDEEHRA